jgi:hypothetical protein
MQVGTSMFLIALMKYGIPALIVLIVVGIYCYLRWRR